MFSEVIGTPRLDTTEFNSRLGYPLPSSWEAKRFGVVARTRSKRGAAHHELLSVYLGRGVIPYSEGGKRVHAPSLDLSLYQEVRPGDLVMNNQQAWRGSVGTSTLEGIVSPAYLVYELAADIDPGYARHLFQTPSMVDQYVRASKGVGDIQRTLFEPYLKSATVPVPPKDEQSAIVKYLGHAHARIDRAIAAKRRLIALLGEQRQAVIHQAVTRGLDPSVPLKDSGVPWLGEIPTHWELAPTRAALRLVKSVVGESHVEQVLLSLTLGGVIVRDLTTLKGKFAVDQSTYQFVKPGQFVFCLFDVDETPRTIGLSRVGGMITGAYRVFECSEELADFVELYFLAMDARKSFRPLYTGLRKTIPVGQLLQSKMPFPPSQERDRIVAAVRDQNRECDELIARHTREVELIREFRARLTSDVVTGQVDVRKVAATLPELTDQPLFSPDEEFDLANVDENEDSDA